MYFLKAMRVFKCFQERNGFTWSSGQNNKNDKSSNIVRMVHLTAVPKYESESVNDVQFRLIVKKYSLHWILIVNILQD